MTEHTYYPICDQCVRAEGDECHTPGCALFLHDAPDHPIHEEHGIDLARVRRDAVEQFVAACKEKRNSPGFLLPLNHWKDIDAAIRVAESYIKNHPETED